MMIFKKVFLMLVGVWSIVVLLFFVFIMNGFYNLIVFLLKNLILFFSMLFCLFIINGIYGLIVIIVIILCLIIIVIVFYYCVLKEVKR